MMRFTRQYPSLPGWLRVGLAVSALAYAALPALVAIMAARDVTTARMADFAAQQRRNTSAIATILGEFRTNLSDMLFIKTERYLHGGVAYMPHIDADQLASSGEIKHSLHSREEQTSATVAGAGLMDSTTTGTSEQHEDEHEHVETLIRPPDKDFRGVLGELERKVKPWRDPSHPHEHIGSKELLPWYRLATLADPKNVRAYMIGAWWLKILHEDKALEEAVKFLDEGIRHNPRSFQLYLMRGHILRELKRHQEALKSYEKAVALMKEQRPRGGEISPRWTIYNEEDAIAACSMAVLQVRELYPDDQQREALKVALERLSRLRNEIENMPALERLERSLRMQLETMP